MWDDVPDLLCTLRDANHFGASPVGQESGHHLGLWPGCPAHHQGLWCPQWRKPHCLSPPVTPSQSVIVSWSCVYVSCYTWQETKSNFHCYPIRIPINKNLETSASKHFLSFFCLRQSGLSLVNTMHWLQRKAAKRLNSQLFCIPTPLWTIHLT